MKNAVICHGWGADSSSNWFPWLKKELRKRDYNVTVPDFPNTMNPSLDEWLRFWEDNISIDEDTNLIGHSLGTPFILQVLQKEYKKLWQGREKSGGEVVRGVFLVSAFHKSLGIAEIESFTEDKFNWSAIQQACRTIYVVNSDNDPYIPLETAKQLTDNLNATLLIEENGDHLNAPAGYLEYPKLLELIVSLEDK